METPITKFVLYEARYTHTENWETERLAEKLGKMQHRIGFQIPSPRFKIKWQKSPPKVQKIFCWEWKEERIILFLEFESPLTEEQLNFWRAFKLGMFCGWGK